MKSLWRGVGEVSLQPHSPRWCQHTWGPLQSPANRTLINLFFKATHEGTDQCFALSSAVFGAHITALIYSL